MSGVLILGGTAEARALAAELVPLGMRVVSSLAGRVANPRLPVGEVREGGFGGPEGLAAWVAAEGIEAVVDATHPFAERMTASAVEAASRTGVPLLVLRRPGWQESPGDRWHRVPTLQAAADLLTTPPLPPPKTPAPPTPAPTIPLPATPPPGSADPERAARVSPDPGRAAWVSVDPASAGPGGAGPGCADPASPGAGSADPGSPGAGSPRPGSAGAGSAGAGSAGAGSAGAGSAGAGSAGAGSSVRRVFLTTGRRSLPVFGGLGSLWFLLRSVDPPAAPVPGNVRVVLGRGPYTVEGERALMGEHRIDVLVTKDSGGEMTTAKLVAARELGIPVIMVDRPPLPDGVRLVEDVAAAISWVQAG